LPQTCVEQRCSEAFAAVRHFEKTHCLALQNMGCAYLQRRADLVGRCLAGAAALGARDDAGHDAVLLMDRVMSTSLALAPDLLELLAAACVVVAAKQVDGPAPAAGGGGGGGGGGAPGGGGGPPPGGGAGLEAASGLPAAAVAQMEWNVRQVLAQDTAAISALRCLKLYLERLGAHHMDPGAAAALAGRALALADGCLADMAFLNCRPSVIAAAVLYTDRRARGAIPFWPTMLAKLTGYQDMSTAELSVAIKAAQRVAARGAGGPAAAAFAPALSLDHAAPSKPLTQLNLAAAAAGRASGVATPSQGVPHAVAATGSGGTSSRGSSGSGGGSGGGSVEEGGLLGITAAVAARYMRRRE
jgi:pentatricopeptide repeat domain-containing protein 1